ncbi:hypothetical protein OF83DRAFT_1179422 [Amylostereum chailletii]|nr:hypothetical protein OF83DRAFT_1179422 [Amylostereum chailletii]
MISPLSPSESATPNLEDAYADVCRQRDLLQSEITLLRTDLKKARAERNAHRQHAEDAHLELARLRAALVGAQAELAVVLGSAHAVVEPAPRPKPAPEPLHASTQADADKELRDNLSTMVVLFDKMRAKMDGLERERGALARERDAALAAKEALAAEYGALRGRVGREKAKLREVLLGIKEPKLGNDVESIADRSSMHRRPTVLQDAKAPKPRDDGESVADHSSMHRRPMSLVAPPPLPTYHPSNRPRCESASTVVPSAHARTVSNSTKGKSRDGDEVLTLRSQKENARHDEDMQFAYASAAVAMEEAVMRSTHSRKVSTISGSSARTRRSHDGPEPAGKRRSTVRHPAPSQPYTHHARDLSHATVAS